MAKLSLKGKKATIDECCATCNTVLQAEWTYCPGCGAQDRVTVVVIDDKTFVERKRADK